MAISTQTIPIAMKTSADVEIRALRDGDLPVARRIFHLAFGTFLGLPDPRQFCPDRDFVISRWHTNAVGAFAAVADGEVVGSSFLANWGSVAVFGPITIRPDFWERGAAKRLLAATVELFPKWRTKHAGLFTFAHSAKHVGLYQKFGFWPRFLTAIMAKPVNAPSPVSDWQRYSETGLADRPRCLQAINELTDSICEGLNLEREVESLETQHLGDMALVWENSKLVGFAICHCGPNTEAGGGNCYIKFAAARSGPRASGSFARLLDACEALAAAKGLTRFEAGTNLAREEAYGLMLARGFRTQTQGVAMHWPNQSGYHRSGVYVIDDWR